MAFERALANNFMAMFSQVKGSYDEWPMLADGVDPMPYFSRNTVALPFYAVSQTDQTVLQLAGRQQIAWGAPLWEIMEVGAGDAVYLPAGLPYRFLPTQPVVQLTLRAAAMGTQAVVWYCAKCRAELPQPMVAAPLPSLQAFFWQAVQTYNQEALRRTCSQCATVHPLVNLADFGWDAVAEEIG